MIEEGLRELIDGADPDDELTLDLSWTGSPPMGPWRDLGVAERRRARAAFYDQRQRPVLARLEAEAGVDVISVPGSPHVLATAPAAVWRFLFDCADNPLHWSDIRVSADDDGFLPEHRARA